LNKEKGVYNESGVRKSCFKKLVTIGGVFEISTLQTQYSQYKKKREALFGTKYYILIRCQAPEAAFGGVIRVDMYSKTRSRSTGKRKDESEDGGNAEKKPKLE
jgi:hypothetical protein